MSNQKYLILCLLLSFNYQLLNTTNNGDHLSAIMSSKFPQISDTGIKNLRHFVYKSIPVGQYIASEWTVPYAIAYELSKESPVGMDPERKTKLLNDNIVNKLRQNVLLSYKRLHMRLHSSAIPTRFIYKVTSTELFFGWVSLIVLGYFCFTQNSQDDDLVSLIDI